MLQKKSQKQTLKKKKRYKKKIESDQRENERTLLRSQIGEGKTREIGDLDTYSERKRRRSSFERKRSEKLRRQL